MKYSSKYGLGLLLGLVLTLGSCEKDLLVEKPLDIITPDNLYVNKAGFESGLYGIYNLIRQERAGTDGGNNNLTLVPAFVGVDNGFGMFVGGGSYEQLFNEFGILVIPTNGSIRQTWEYMYKVVNAANTVIGRAENPAINWTPAEKNQIVGEARLMRAWAYRHLTFLWGDVPLNLVESTGATIRTDFDRTPVAEVRRQMEADLLFAEANMAEVAANAARMPRAVATHYLAELYLTTGENQKAKDKAQSLVQNPLYKLITARYGVRANQPGTPFTDMFLDGNSNRREGNTEAIWVLQNEYQSLGGDNNIMRRWWVNRYETISVSGKRPIAVTADNGGRGLGRFGITRFGLNLYGPTDDRGSYHTIRQFWIMNNPASLPTGAKLGDTVRTTRTVAETLNNPNWPSTRKWDWAPTIPEDVQNGTGYNDQIYLRLGETYLLLAEAQFKLGDLAGAATTINALRARAQATPITAASVTLDFILDERSRELITEEHRRYTLLRTDKWAERTTKYNAITKNKITDRDKLLPIPQSVIDANISKPMPQNPGY